MMETVKFANEEDRAVHKQAVKIRKLSDAELVAAVGSLPCRRGTCGRVATGECAASYICDMGQKIERAASRTIEQFALSAGSVKVLK